MARLLGPDANSRRIDLGDGRSAWGRTATVYTDATGTQLADIAAYDGTTTPGASISGSKVTVDNESRLPLFWFPNGVDTLYARVTGLAYVEKIVADEAGRFAPSTMSVAGTRPVVSAQHGRQVSQRQYTFLNSKTQHIINATCSDLRLVYTGGHPNEGDLTNPVFIKVGASLDGTTYYPVTFGGKQSGQLDPHGVLVSDPIPFDVTAGQSIYLSLHMWQAFGVSTTLAASSSIGASALSFTALPKITAGLVVINSGSLAETVEIESITGAGPYTATLRNGTTCAKAHSSGVYVGQQLVNTATDYTDQGAAASAYATASGPDRSYTGTYSATAAATTTVGGSSTVTAGSTSVPLAALITSPSLVLGSGGSQETVTVVNIVGAAAPYTYYLAAPTVFDHAVGDTAAAGLTYASVTPPTAIVADRVAAGAAPCVVGVGTSIMAATGYYLRGLQVYATLAFNGHNPFINCAVGSESASQFVTQAVSNRRRRLLSLGKWLLVGYATNDLATGRSLSQLQADLTTIINMGRSRGMRIALETCIPRTTSTDGFATVGNQTLPSWEAVRLAYNAWARGGAGGLADLVIDTDSKIDSGLVTGVAAIGKWRVDGTNGPWTPDGIHPATIGHLAMATAIDPSLFA